jgi:hypothetical protein
MAAAQFRHQVQCNPCCNEAAHDQAEHLEDVGVADHLHAAQRDDGGEHGQEQHAGKQVQSGNARNRDRAQVQDGGQVHHNVQAQPEQGHGRGHRLAVALLEELGHGVDAVLQVDRHEEDGHDDERGGGHQFIHGDRHADLVAGATHADELFCRDVRGDQRCADCPPAERALGQEVVMRRGTGGAFLAPVHP